ncbi:MAG TPA: beta-L-arabinofuranosidase domain-containing protein [Anaerolineales bacterium]|nr:beta-L-arabinofuranosidase domain-containing protein [Anaerolineales bacterium]
MNTTITKGFWHERLEVNAQRAIFHQWDQLEASGCIENFRIAAGEVDGLRTGWFFADSDAYKWLDAASRIYASFPDPKLASIMDEFIALLARAQQSDGYIFTYNQIHFPGTRWVNLQIEHELYCHGHLIEAGVSHYRSTHRTDLLNIAHRAADRIVADFRGKGAQHTPGHEEIEIALLRLYQVTQHRPYLEQARQFIEQRGRNPLFGLSVLKQNKSVKKRGDFVQEKKQEYLAAHPEYKPYQLPSGNVSKRARNAKLRWYASALTGKYFQQHAPVRKQAVPVGHSVRFGYLETATAMLAREIGDQTLLPALEQSWYNMVTRRMYITGGIGSLPGLEGFGNDYELDPEYAYAETCAALASLFWSWEMAGLTGEAKYSDLFEWQLYNAATVGMGLDGCTYLYNNPLTSQGGVTRKPWYAVPCCPSNLSRTWGNLGNYIYSSNQGELQIHQYISSELNDQTIELENGKNAALSLTIDSAFPFDEHVTLKLTGLSAAKLTVPFTIKLRYPSWATGMTVHVNSVREGLYPPITSDANDVPASGYDPRQSSFHTLHRDWVEGDEISLHFEMPILTRRAHSKVKGHRGKIAITRGSLVYCLESVDNCGVDIFNVQVNLNSLEPRLEQTAMGQITVIHGKSTTGEPLTFIPYFLWGNRGNSQMTVWVKEHLSR